MSQLPTGNAQANPPIFKLNDAEVKEWLLKNVPHRVRASLAITKRLETLLTSLPQWPVKSKNERIARRCETDAIWEGRLVSMRWLTEFVGLTEDKNGNPIRRPKTKPNDFGIDDLPDGVAIDLNSAEAGKLARFWKGSTQGSGHPTHQTGHPPVNECELDEALDIIMKHLDKTIYSKCSKKIADLVTEGPP